jgi:hypothetical protein
LTIYLDDRRRRAAGWISKIQHVIAGIPLLIVGIEKFAADAAERPIATLEIAIALAVLVAFVRELRAEFRQSKSEHGEATHSRFAWFDLAAGALLIFEAFHGHHTKPGYLRPQFYSGLVAIGLGLFHHRLQRLQQRRRYLKLDETGIEFRFGPFRKLDLKWNELASMDLNEQKVVLHRTDGRSHSIRLSWFRNSEAAYRALCGNPAAAALVAASHPGSPSVTS